MPFTVESKKTTIKLLDNAPYVLIRREALDKMFHYTDICKEEVGWLGTAYRQDGVYQIDDVFLFDQEVHATTTEITTEGLSKFGEELLMNSSINGMEIWNNLKIWGHSHVNMSTSPSGQDDAQMEKFAETGHDFFIRLICNKKGDLRVDVYDYSTGIAYMDTQWYVQEPSEVESLLDAINALEQELEAIKEKGLTMVEPTIKEEVKTKVKPLITAWKGATIQPKTQYDWKGFYEKYDKEEEKANGGIIINSSGTSKDFWQNDNEVIEDLSIPFLIDLSGLPIAEIEQELMLSGYYDVISDNDLFRVKRIANNYGGYDYYDAKSY